jgi:hypothetical protein
LKKGVFDQVFQEAVVQKKDFNPRIALIFAIRNSLPNRAGLAPTSGCETFVKTPPLYYIGATKRVVLAQKESFRYSVVSGRGKNFRTILSSRKE